jgi:hypothetical protein
MTVFRLSHTLSVGCESTKNRCSQNPLFGVTKEGYAELISLPHWFGSHDIVGIVG